MNDTLRTTVQNFLVDYDNTANDLTSIADYNLWLETAVELLQKCVVDDYKIIPQDQKSWHYAKPIIGVDDKGMPIAIDSWNKNEKQ